MRTKLMIATAAAAALLAGSAFAQAAPASGSNLSQNQPGDTAVNPVPLAPGAGAAAPSGPAPAPLAASPDATQPNAPADATVAPAAGAPTERAPAASVGGADVVSNGPVPDTPANRAKYGKPMSNAGRMTKPAGN